MKLNLAYKWKHHQTEFLKDIRSHILMLSGGMGSGKSFVLVSKILHLSYLNRMVPGGLVCPDFSDFKRDMLPMIEQVLDERKIKYYYHANDHYFKFPWQNTWAKLYVVTAEKKIRGPNWGYAGINEVTLIKPERFQDVVSRVRIKTTPLQQIACVGTPEGIMNPYYDIFVTSPPAGFRMIKGSTYDNADNLGEAYIAAMESNFDATSRKAYMHGEWVNMRGDQFYYNYQPEKHDDFDLVGPEHGYVLCSMDFNVDPLTATMWHKNGDSIGAFDQIELAGEEGFDTHKMVRAMMIRGYTPENTIVYPDPAGRARSTKGKPDVQILEEAGYQVAVRTVAPSFRARQLNANNLFEKGRIKLHPVKASGLKRDLLGVEQDKVTLEKKKNNPKLTHFSDGMDYMLDIVFPFSGNRSKVSEVKIR